MTRERIVSIRLTDAEDKTLRDRAHIDGITVSEVIRRIIRAEFADPLPRGVTVGNATPLVQATTGELVQAGVFWPDGTVGNTWTTTMEDTHG